MGFQYFYNPFLNYDSVRLRTLDKSSHETTHTVPLDDKIVRLRTLDKRRHKTTKTVPLN